MYKLVVLLAVGFAQAKAQYLPSDYPQQARSGPYAAAVLAPAPVAIQGSKYLDTQLDAPQQPAGAGLTSPVIPPNSKVTVQDNRLQYSTGFNDEKSGISVAEQGSLLSTNDGWETVVVKRGRYSYISPEGIPITVNYIADQNGFRTLPNDAAR